MSREGHRRWGVLQTFVVGRQGNPMMKRLRVVQTPWFGIYLHFIYREDLDPITHDHPWNFWRMVLRGGYVEEYLTDPAAGKIAVHAVDRWRPTRVPTTHAHRITSVRPGTVSLVVVGRKSRVWGFWREVSTSGCSCVMCTYRSQHRLWVDYRDALGLRPNEGVSS